jgi:hypothetical protein
VPSSCSAPTTTLTRAAAATRPTRPTT